jgi:hypothetical protein
LSACRARRSRHAALAADPDVTLLNDKPGSVEAQERDADEFLRAAIDELRAGAPRNRCAITVNDRHPELTPRRLLLLEHAGDIARFRLAERMLLPEHAHAVERTNGVRVMLVPTSLPDIRPPLRCLAGIHTLSLVVHRHPGFAFR